MIISLVFELASMTVMYCTSESERQRGERDKARRNGGKESRDSPLP